MLPVAKMFDRSRMTPVDVKLPGRIGDKQREIAFGLLTGTTRQQSGDDRTVYDVWLPDTDQVVMAFGIDVLNYDPEYWARKEQKK